MLPIDPDAAYEPPELDLGRIRERALHDPLLSHAWAMQMLALIERLERTEGELGMLQHAHEQANEEIRYLNEQLEKARNDQH